MMFTQFIPRGLSLLLLLSIVSLLIRPGTAHACDCDTSLFYELGYEGAMAHFTEQSDIAFYGSVMQRDPISPGRYDVTFEVTYIYNSELATPVLTLDYKYDDCLFSFTDGYDYLVFAYENSDQVLTTGGCVGTERRPSNGTLDTMATVNNETMHALPPLEQSILSNIHETVCMSFGNWSISEESYRLDCPYSAGHSFTIEISDLATTTCDLESTVADSHGISNALTTYTQPFLQWCVQTTAFNDTPHGVTASLAFDLFYKRGVEMGLFSTELIPTSVKVSQQTIRDQNFAIYGYIGLLTIISGSIFHRMFREALD